MQADWEQADWEQADRAAHTPSQWKAREGFFFPVMHLQIENKTENNEIGNQALKALMMFCCSLMSADVAPEAPPSRAPQVILHPVLSEPG